MIEIQRKVLGRLLDSYEKSKTFQGENKVNQRFAVEVEKLFSRYRDDAEYEFFCRVNEALLELEQQAFIELEWKKKGVLKKAVLRLDSLEACYEKLGRTPRKQEQEDLLNLLQEFLTEACEPDRKQELQPLILYLQAQQERISKNKNVEYYEHDLADYKELLKLIGAVLTEQGEIFVRNLSMRLFGDSKRVEQLEKRVEALLFQYGEFEEKDSVLEECGIVHTPTYVMIKGNGRIRLGTQEIELSALKGDIALSTESIKELESVAVQGMRVVTVENLTSFHEYGNREDFVIYLGGFHNKIKREFLTFLYAQNQEKEYRHFGDIDAGGFYILEHLKRKTEIPFTSLYMDAEILCRYADCTKPLTNHDRTRLERLEKELEQKSQTGTLTEDYRATIRFMLEKGCKLEQEAVKVV